MRKYRAHDEMTRHRSGLYVTLGADGGVESVFVTHGPIGTTLSVAEYLSAKLTPDFRSLPTRKKLQPKIEILG